MRLESEISLIFFCRFCSFGGEQIRRGSLREMKERSENKGG